MKKINFKWKSFTGIFLGGVLLALGASIILAATQTVTDTYNNENLIANSWRAEIATSTGEIKIATRECNPDVWICGQATTCANDLGDGDYIIVAQEDISTTKQWKTTNTNCDQPQCGIDGGQLDHLVGDNTIDFSLYPARDACKEIGGRLPTRTELGCMYTNRAVLGNNYESTDYWSATELYTSSAYYRTFSNGSGSSNFKSSNYRVRCVLGW